MSAEASIVTTLGPLVSGRVYPSVAPEDAPMPLIVYQQISGDGLQFMDGTLPNRENGRFQISVWAQTQSQAVTLAKQVESVLCANQSTLQTTILGGRRYDYDLDTRAYGCSQDFSFWSIR